MSQYDELKRLAINCRTERCADEDEQARNERDFLLEVDPEEILALIAENERLKESHEQVCTNYNQVSYASEERGKQIDQLRAEVAGLKTGYQAYERVNAELKAENEALRKRIDDLSPFKGAPLTGPDTKCLACGGHHSGLGGLPCPKMNAVAQALSMDNQRITPVEPLLVPHPLEAAMGRGEQS